VGQVRGRLVAARFFTGVAVASTVLAGAVVLVLAVNAVTHPTVRIVSGSMVPAIPIGTIVVFRDIPATMLHVGQVLGFRAPHPFPSVVVVHEVVRLARRGSFWLVRTEGIANHHPDPWTLMIPMNRNVQVRLFQITPLQQLLIGAIEVVAIVSALTGALMARRQRHAGRLVEA